MPYTGTRGRFTARFTDPKNGNQPYNPPIVIFQHVRYGAKLAEYTYGTHSQLKRDVDGEYYVDTTLTLHGTNRGIFYGLDSDGGLQRKEVVVQVDQSHFIS